VSTDTSQSSLISSRRPGVTWLLAISTGAALLIGIWAWSAKGASQPATAAVRSVLLTDAMAPVGKGRDVRAESTAFVTHARTWTAYWSYFCLIPGMVREWHTRLWLIRLQGGSAVSRRLLYSASSSNGPVSYTQFFREPGPGTFRFVVETTRHCVWSVRAPPVAGHGMAS
jgi:hypothetical protein